MRAFLTGCVAALCACSTPAPSVLPEPPAATAPPAVAPPPAPPPPELLAADTPRSTVEGATFIAPAGWSIAVRGPATILEAPEGGSYLAFVDVKAPDADAAVAAAWAAYKPEARWPLKVTTDAPDKDGWTNRRAYDYQTSPNEKRDVAAYSRRAGEVWTVIIYDMAQAVGEKRSAAVSLVFGRLLPKGYARESFAGKKAHRLDAERLARLARLGRDGHEGTGRAGRGGRPRAGRRDRSSQAASACASSGKPQRPDADTLFMIASNTKALTTLMLAKLVDEKKLDLGDAGHQPAADLQAGRRRRRRVRCW